LEKDDLTLNANHLQFFFDVQQRLLQNACYYWGEYEGIVPEFKAGLHFGYVMVGEKGVVKREVAYSGNVLNIATRIQSKCNEIDVSI
jgi:adenylate cyclase